MPHAASAIILAGGRSHRMGRQKAALPFENTTLLDRLLAELTPAFAELIVVTAPVVNLSRPLSDILARWGEQVRTIHDPEVFAGPAAALVRGLGAGRYATAFVCSCDLPLLRAPVAAMLCDQLEGFDAAIPVVEGRRQPLAAAYRTAAAALIESIVDEGESRLTVITSRLAVRLIEADTLRPLDPDLRSFLNVNTPADYARALSLAHQ